jgi:hypothetical protein
VAYFDQAAKLSPNPVLADLAGLNSALALIDTAPYKDVEARLTPLMGEKSPYRVQAKEALAFAKLQAGDLAGARGDFLVLSSSLDNSSDEIRERAQARDGHDRFRLRQGSAGRGQGRHRPAAVRRR